MAYARFGGRKWVKYYPGCRFEPSEVYIYGDRTHLNCVSCRISPQKPTDEFWESRERYVAKLNQMADENGYPEDHWLRLPPVDRTDLSVLWFDTFTTNSRRAMMRHLRRHRKAGHAVPKHTLKRLEREIRREGDEY